MEPRSPEEGGFFSDNRIVLGTVFNPDCTIDIADKNTTIAAQSGMRLAFQYPYDLVHVLIVTDDFHFHVLDKIFAPSIGLAALVLTLLRQSRQRGRRSCW